MGSEEGRQSRIIVHLDPAPPRPTTFAFGSQSKGFFPLPFGRTAQCTTRRKIHKPVRTVSYPELKTVDPPPLPSHELSKRVSRSRQTYKRVGKNRIQISIQRYTLNLRFDRPFCRLLNVYICAFMKNVSAFPIFYCFIHNILLLYFLVRSDDDTLFDSGTSNEIFNNFFKTNRTLIDVLLVSYR